MIMYSSPPRMMIVQPRYTHDEGYTWDSWLYFCLYCDSQFSYAQLPYTCQCLIPIIYQMTQKGIQGFTWDYSWMNHDFARTLYRINALSALLSQYPSNNVIIQTIHDHCNAILRAVIGTYK